MEIFKKKSLILKIVIAIVVVILFNFSAPTVSQAASIGGTLLQPIVSLLTAFGDGIMLVIQSILFGVNYSVITLTDDPPGSILESILDFGSGILNWGANLVDSVIGTNISSITEGWIPSVFYLPIYAVSPEEIFQNKIGVLDVNFFNPNPYEEIELPNGAVVEEQTSTASALQATISSWYLTLRNFAMVVLLIVLLYIGIRIVASSASQERAKYKEKLFSWIVAMCLLVFMHYIMSVAVTIVEAVSEGINQINNNIAIGMENLDDYYVEVQDDEGENQYVEATTYFNENNLVQDGQYVWPTNLLGKIRIEMQLEPTGVSEDNVILRKMGYTVLYLMLVFYTVAFLVVYIKRTIMLAFLTMIAPLVAMTYPLDKMNDGNAQAFNMWLKEYVFNLLIQPFHLILYTMLVGSAIEFATENLIYSVVAIGFIFQAEKLLRKFFGFDKASTIDTNGSTIAGMAGMTAINALKRVGGGRGRGKSGSGSNNENSGNNNGKIRQADKGRSTRDLLNARQARQGIQPAQNTNNQPTVSLAARTQALQKYGDEGYGQNANGEYFNPWTNEYDANYDPALDNYYNSQLNTAQTAQPAQTSQYAPQQTPQNVPQQLGQVAQQGGQPLQPLPGQQIRQHLNAGQSQDPNQPLPPPEPDETLTLGQRLAKNFAATPDDTRGAGQWLADGIGQTWNESNLKKGILQSKEVAKLKSVGAKASELKQNAENKIKNTKISDKYTLGDVAKGAKKAASYTKPIRNTIRGAATVAGKAATYAVPRAGKLYAKAALGVAAGTVGVAAGLASADDRNIMSWGGAGLAAGWAAGSAGSNIAGNVAKSASNIRDNVVSTYTVAAKGEKAEKERQQAIEDKAAMKDKERQKLYMDKLNIPRSEVKQVMQEAQEYRKSGITDDKLIIKAMKADEDKFGPGRANEERIILAGLASEVGNDNKKIKDLESRLKERGLSDKDVNKFIGGIREINDVV